MRPDVDDWPVLAICYGDFTYHDKIRNMPTTMAENPKFRAWDTSGSFEPNAFDIIVIDNAKNKSILRFRKLVEQNPNAKILALRDNSENSNLDMQEFLKELGSPPKSMIKYLDDFEPLKVVRSTLPGQSARPFKCYISNYEPSGRSSYQTQLPPDGGVYIPMLNFISDDLSSKDLSIVRDLYKPKNIIWLNKTDLDNSNIENKSEWITVADAVKGQRGL